MSKTTSCWRELLQQALAENGETLTDIVSTTLTIEQLTEPFDPWGDSLGAPFTAWTARRVYFPATYDSAKWVASVSRNPDGVPTQPVGQ